MESDPGGGKDVNRPFLFDISINLAFADKLTNIVFIDFKAFCLEIMERVYVVE